jgi:hypothetical protein
MVEINFEYNWCDYLTPCPYIKNKEVGSYECSTCEYCNELNYDESLKTDDTPVDDKNYCKRYFIINVGVCKCSFMNNTKNK